MRLGTVMCYAYVMSMFFIGSTHSCNTYTLNICSIALIGKADPYQRRGAPTSEELAVLCSKFKVCVNNVAYCALDTAPVSSTGYFASAKGLCEDWINKDSTDSCNTDTLNTCSIAVVGKAGTTRFGGTPTSEELAVLCSQFKVCVNNVANCALDTTPVSSYDTFASAKDVCEDWINKDRNGVSTLTPCLTFIMAIMFAVMTFTRMMT